MSKRGQVFILAAILLAVILFSLATVRNKFEQKTIRGDFEVLSDNFQIESSKYINSVVQSNGTADKVHTSFESFATMFTSYAKGKNPEYGLIYALSFGDKIQVANFLNRKITVTGCYEQAYSVSIEGAFGRVPADLNFSGFTIETSGIVWGDLGPECQDIPSPVGSISTSKFCVYLPPLPRGRTDLAIKIEGQTGEYFLCVTKGIPELMQVSVVRQEEQAKVSSSGKCAGQDFCSNFKEMGSAMPGQEIGCLGCGKGACCWWPIPSECDPTGPPGDPTGPYGGVCLSNSSYYSRCNPPGNPTCQASCSKEQCYSNMKCHFDSCDVAEPKCELCLGRVCRNKNENEAECCTQNQEKRCSDNNIYWFDSCGARGNKITPDCERYCTTDTDPDECCIPQTGKVCSDDSKLICDYYDNCGNEADCNTDCEGDGKVCRDKDDDPSFLQARCCQQNFEKKCDNNDLYWFDSCGIKGNLAEDCARYCSTQTNKCCIQQTGQVCSDDLTKICDYYDGCGNKADCNTDCSANNKVCKCTPSNVCNCVGAHKQFRCRSEYWTGWGDCGEGEPDCESGYEKVYCNDDDCGFMGWWEEYNCLCRRDYWTDCFENPSCGSDAYLGEQACSSM